MTPWKNVNHSLLRFGPVPRQNHRRNDVTAAKLWVGRSFANDRDWRELWRVADRDSGNLFQRLRCHCPRTEVSPF